MISEEYWKSLKTCPECNGNSGWFNGTDGNTYLSEVSPDVTPESSWQRCPFCDGAGRVEPAKYEEW